MKTSNDLLPGLPNDVALECLTRMSIDTLPRSCKVCTGWRAEIESPQFLKRRKNSKLTRSIVVVSQAWTQNTSMGNRFYRLVVCDPEKDEWSELPPIPDLPMGLPILCHLAGVRSELVVIGGCDPITWQVLDSVFIYSFATGKWRSGAHMPGGQRLLFGSASDSERTVYIAGGHNEDKNSLKSALAYDMVLDKWTVLPDMKTARDECIAIFHNKKFHVISGYGTETQGVFGRDSEAFDVSMWRWGPVEEHFLKDATSATKCAGGQDGNTCVYVCQNGNVMEREGTTWRVVAGLPNEVRHVDFVTAWRGKLLVVGYASFEDGRTGYLMDLETRLWTKIEASQEYLGHVQSGCYLEI